MKLFRLFVFALAAISIAAAQEAATPGATPNPNPSPNPQATLSYIHAAWDTLTRSMTDCHSLVDIKVTANPDPVHACGCARACRRLRNSSRSAT